MKKFLLSIYAFCVTLSSFANITLNGVDYTIDTLSMYSVGPGSKFYELRMLKSNDGSGRLDCWLMTIDTRNPYVSVEQILGKGQVTGLERPSDMAKRSTTDTKIFFGGVNGDFYANSTPVGTTIVNSEYALTPWGAGGGRRAGGVDSEKKGVTAYTHAYSMRVVIPNGDTLNINHANGAREENHLVLYNHHKGANTSTNAYGTEVQIQLLEGEKWATTGVMRAKVLKKEERIGSMPLTPAYAVLSGHGTMETALKTLSEGDELTLIFEILLDGQSCNVAQMIGGDHYAAMILDDGVVATDGFWNELHPRTGYGVSQTRDTIYFLVVDGRGISKGCTTKVLAEILKYYGAWNAVNWDGGGSSCMYVRPLGQVNNGSDGNERTVTNGMFAVANLPEADNTIATIAPYVRVYSLPRYAVAAPKFLGYNKYGVLLDTDVQGVTLSCDSSLGEILEDGRFLASGEKGGVLHAALGHITTDLEIELLTSAPIAIRLDSVLCDATHPYQIEVQSVVGKDTIALLAEALTWTSLDLEVATVDETGTVVGVKNGSTWVVGQLGDFRDSILINVEIPTSHQMIWDDFRTIDNWTLKGSSGFNPTLSVPEDAAAPVNMLFDYKSARNPYVQLVREAPIYSRPDTIRIPMTTNAIFSKVYVVIRPNNTVKTQNVVIEPNQTGEIIFDIPVEKHFGTDVAIFPLQFESIKVYLNTSTEVGERYVTLPGIQLLYGAADETALTDVLSSGSAAKFMENGQLFIRRNDNVYTILGTQK